jgi:hypothetical protein
MLGDDPEPPEDEFVDFAAYGIFIPTSRSRPPRDDCEPRLETLTDNTRPAPQRSVTRSVRRIYAHNLQCLLQQLRQRGNKRGSGRVVVRICSFDGAKGNCGPLHNEPSHMHGDDRRRTPVLDWATSALPREDKRSHMRTRRSPSSPTTFFVHRGRRRSPASLTPSDKRLMAVH